jgi:hypothetical protein
MIPVICSDFTNSGSSLSLESSTVSTWLPYLFYCDYRSQWHLSNVNCRNYFKSQPVQNPDLRPPMPQNKSIIFIGIIFIIASAIAFGQQRRNRLPICLIFTTSWSLKLKTIWE